MPYGSNTSTTAARACRSCGGRRPEERSRRFPRVRSSSRPADRAFEPSTSRATTWLSRGRSASTRRSTSLGGTNPPVASASPGPTVLKVELPPGTWQAEWIDTKVGTVVGRTRIDGGGVRDLASPAYDDGHCATPAASVIESHQSFSGGSHEACGRVRPDDGRPHRAPVSATHSRASSTPSRSSRLTSISTRAICAGRGTATTAG